MERVLRSEEISRLIEAACSYTKDCFYFPVRHHSPACAFHLRQVIEEYQPDCILIEGPENANELIADMVDPGTKAPFCIYYSYRDKKGYVDEKNGDYRCYYPFLDYSPELVAMREGSKIGASLSFMDLPYEEILIAQKEGIGLRKQNEQNSYNDDRYLSENQFLNSVVEKSSLRGFDEFWERHFEMEGLLSPIRPFLEDMLYYCVLSRANTREKTLMEDGCLAREAYMRKQIAAAREKYHRVLVVTGGFHVAGLVGAKAWLLEEKTMQALGGAIFEEELPEGLLASLGENKLHPVDKKDKGVYLMSYSMAATDRLNGYCSGMVHPMFYQCVWEGAEEGSQSMQEIFRQTILRFLVEVGRRVRRKESYPSTYDEICAMTMCDQLASLRGKPFPGVFELWDSVLSNYVKGEYQISTDRPMRVLREVLTGDLIGKLTGNAKLPPLCADFEKQCQSFRLDIHGNQKKEITLSPFGKKKHREVSAFFQRMDFLGSEFALRKKGPNLRLRKDRNLIREIWEYHFSPKVMSTLIENAMYGGSIEEACKALAEKKVQEETDAAAASYLIIRMFEMGQSVEDPGIMNRLGEILQGCEDFFSLTKTFSNLIMLLDMQELYGYEADMLPLRNLVAQKLLALLGHMAGIKDEDVGHMLEALKELYRVMLDAGMVAEKEFFIRSLEKLSRAKDLNPSLAGAVWGLLYAYGARTADEVSVCMQGYLFASGEKALRSADYVRGLFFTARDILFAQEGMIDMLDSFLARTSYEDFLKLLPAFRLAFSFFTPVETDRLAGRIAGRFGLKKREFRELEEVTGEEMAYGRALEAEILRILDANG